MGSEAITSMPYARIIRAVRDTPWAIIPSRLADIVDVLRFQAGGGKLTPEEIRAYVDVEAAARREPEARRGKIAVLGVRGIIANRIEQVDNISGPGGTSVESLTNRFRGALADDSVKAIILDIDSPGGSVDGVQEFATEVLEARGRKPIRAIANTLAASAAYWVGVSADELSVTPSGEVGSIGVFASHSDLSAALEADGEKITLIHAGRYKVEGNPFEPLSDSAREYIQTRVDAHYGAFTDHVGRSRGVDTSAVVDGFGEGRVVSATDAVEIGMADRVETLDSLVERLGADLGRQRARSVGRSAHEFAFI